MNEVKDNKKGDINNIVNSDLVNTNLNNTNIINSDLVNTNINNINTNEFTNEVDKKLIDRSKLSENNKSLREEYPYLRNRDKKQNKSEN